MKNWNFLLRTLVYGTFAGVLALGFFEIQRVARQHEDELQKKEQEIRHLVDRVAEKDLAIQKLAAAMKLLKVDHRVARIQVLDQSPLSDGSGRLQTTLSFQELGPEGAPLGPAAEISLLGTVAYLDALVIKFDDDYVEKGDFLRGTAICLFRRLFGEYQQPSEGFPLDPVGTRPRAYSVENVDPEFEQELWSRFWDYANDRQLAESLGVRALQGEAPYMQLRPGKSYRVELRSSGGLNIIAEN